jgi:hypothetical protein
MRLRFYKDPETDLPHICNHGVTEDEVRQVLARPGSNSRGSRNSRTIMGQTLAGRYLKVVFVPDPNPNSGFVVTAYELRGKALKAFRRKQRRRSR